MRTRLRFTVTDAVGITGRFLWLWNAEQLPRSCDVVGAPAIGEETVVTDAVEPVGQDMDQEAADELVGVERHKLAASVALGPVIRPFEGHSLAVEGNEPAVGDRDPVRVAGQISEDSVGSAEGSLGIHHPFDLSQCGEASFEGCRLGQGGLVGEERQPPGLIRGSELFQEQAPEQP